MTDPKVQHRYEEFTRDFALPIFRGGTVQVGRPVTPGMLDVFGALRPMDTEVDRGIFDCLLSSGSLLAPLRSVPWPSRGLAAVMMAGHNLVASTDPELDKWGTRGALERMLDWADWLLERADAPTTRGEALARHAFVDRFLELRREDVTASNWAFTHRYLGRPVPEGFLTKPRWVNVTTERPNVLQLWSLLEQDFNTSGRRRKLLDRSPVTSLLRTDLEPNLRFSGAVLAVLSDDLVRNGLARELVAQGRSTMAPLGRALRRLAAVDPPTTFLYYALALLYEMHVIAVLDTRPGKESPFGRPSNREEALFCGVLPGMVSAPDDLEALLDMDESDLARVRERAAQLETQLGGELVARAVDLVAQASPPRLDHERPPVAYAAAEDVAARDLTRAHDEPIPPVSGGSEVPL